MISEDDTELKKLRSLLKSDMISYDANSTNRKSKYTEITLSETNTKEPYKIKITQVPTDFLLIQTDKDNRIPITKEHADYCLIAKEKAENGKKKWIVYIELKKGKGAKNKVKTQLIGAKCLIEYCKIAMKEFENDTTFLAGFEERFVCISKNGPPEKRTTKISSEFDINNTAETFRTLKGESINFKQCI